ncbi:MAG: 50S ribosomal protein L32e [Candidatus Heimdallarchaeaceae archaeon]
MISSKRKILKKRAEISSRRPKFVRQESWRYKRLKPNWRRPKGIDNKMREKRKGYPALVSVGYRGPKEARGLHPSGYDVVHVYNVFDLELVDPETEAIIIGRTVGERKKRQILDAAEDRNIKVLNPPAAAEEIGELLEGAEFEEEYELLEDEESLEDEFELEEDLEDEASEENNT